MHNISWLTVGLLVISNFMMSLAWYGHLRLKCLSGMALWKVILVSWAIALCEYSFMIPANRIGKTSGMSLEQLKITQEAISLLVFVPFSLFVMRESVSWNYAAAAACILGAVFFIFRG